MTQAAKSLGSLAKRTAATHCKLALSNHGGWSGNPAKLVAVCQKLYEIGHKHLGIVSNWHHSHPRINSWAKDLALMKPYLHCLNLNGMKEGVEFKVLPLGQGEHETACSKRSSTAATPARSTSSTLVTTPTQKSPSRQIWTA